MSLGWPHGTVVYHHLFTHPSTREKTMVEIMGDAAYSKEVLSCVGLISNDVVGTLKLWLSYSISPV